MSGENAERDTPDSTDIGALADRFLVAFARTEQALRTVLGASSSSSFRWLVRQAAGRNATVRSFEDDLTEFSELRNAIVHERGGGYVIAEPHPDVVERLEKIVELIVEPPRIDAVMSRPVVRATAHEPVAEAAKRMVDGGFSRLPVFDDDVFIGLLTANAIARWVAARLAGPPESLREESVAQVLGYGEAGRRFEVVDRQRLVTDVVAMFADAHRSGRQLETVLVTPMGSEVEAPIGIVTVQDLPRLYALITA